jgi:iron complex outermembrane receptor protein
MCYSLMAGVCALALLPAMAQAEDQPNPAGAVAGATPSATDAVASSGEIVVTASKRVQNVQNVPISVTAVGEERLKQVNITNTANLSEVAPGITFVPAPNPNVVQFVVRGVGTFAFADTLEQSVGVAIDGVPLGRVAGAVVDMVDISRVELLRGPQGTLFGKSATAGLISIVTNKPVLDHTEFSGRVLGGENKEFRAQGAANIPIIADTLAIRLTGWDFSRDGYIRAPHQPDGNVGDFRDRGGRAKLAWQVMPGWRIDASAEIVRNWNDGPDLTTRSYLSSDFLSFQGGPSLAQQNAADGIVAGPDNKATGMEAANMHGWVKPQFYELESNWDLGHQLTFTSVSAYRHTTSLQIGEYDWANSGPSTYHTYQNYQSTINQFSSELRLANSSLSKFQYTLGLFYYDLDIPKSLIEQDTLNNPLNPPPYYARGRQIQSFMNTKNYAAFADTSLNLGKLTLIAGGRYSHEHSTGTFNRVTPQFVDGANGQDLSIFIPGSTAVGFPPYEVSTATTYNDFSWRAGAQYHVTSDVMAYFMASRAYKGPGFNFSNDLNAATFALNDAIVKAEIAHSIEAGVRTQLFDRVLTLNLSAYRSPFDNFQITAAVPNAVGGLTYTIINAGQILAKGIEGDFSLRPRGALKGFSIDGNFAYNDTRYSDFPNAPCYPAQVAVKTPTTEAGVCAPVSSTVTATVQSVNGLRTVGSPAWQVNLFGGYERPVSQSLRAFGSLHYFYQSQVQYGVGNNPATLAAGYHTVDLTLGLGAIDDRWKLSVIGRNIFDKNYVVRIAALNPGVEQAVPYEAQSAWVLALDFKF